MKPENNLQNKARFFGQYFDQEVYFNPRLGYVHKLSTPQLSTHMEGYLELTPLSAITDEDTIEVWERWRKIDPLAKAIQGPIKYIKENIHKLASLLKPIGDYMISEGYAVDQMGLTVEEQIERGWIKLKEV